jgi:hypothetical protein
MKLASLQAEFGRWLRAECPDAAAQLGRGPGLDIYLNNYRSQLIHALESGYPQLRRWLGDAAFFSAAARHIETAPPHSWTLDAYGADFAQTIAALYPDDPTAVDLAQIEWGLAAAFTTPDAVPVAAAALGGVDWERARFRFVPSMTLLRVTTNAAALWQALAAGAAPPPAAALTQPATVLFWRRGFHPSFRSAERAEAEALQQLLAGTCFGALCDALAAVEGAEQGATIAGSWLGGWLRDGLIAEIF